MKGWLKRTISCAIGLLPIISCSKESDKTEVKVETPVANTQTVAQPTAQVAVDPVDEFKAFISAGIKHAKDDSDAMFARKGDGWRLIFSSLPEAKTTFDVRKTDSF